MSDTQPDPRSEGEDTQPITSPATGPGDGGGDQDGGLPERISEDLGGVQGAAPPEGATPDNPAALRASEPDDEPVPDAGEIEWAGQVVKKPPTAA